MKQHARQGSGAPSHCWQCMKQLQRAPGRGLGLFYFELVRDKGGTEHRVHQGCLSEALEDGNKHVEQVAA